MRSHLVVGVALAATLVGLSPRPAAAQNKDRLVLALYAPSIAFKDTESRLAYLKLLADAIASNVGRGVEPRLYGSLTQLRRANPDFAIVEAQCAAGGSTPWRPIATAKIGGKLARHWSLYGAQGQTVASLRGKRLSYAASGCEDKEFLENVLFGSEVRLRYFGGTSPKATVSGAVAEVATVRAAQAVFAPDQQAGGLDKLFDAGEVPNPVLVVANPRLGGDVVGAVEQAVQRFGSSGAIDGWGPADRKAQSELGRRMQGTPKRFVFAEPPPSRIPVKGLIEVARGDTKALSVRRYFDVDARP